MLESVVAIAAATLAAGTPLVLAGLGELVTERAGVLNLGVEGMMLVGAVCGFMVAADFANLWLATGAAILAGGAMAALFGVLTLFFQANQVAAGLALTIFGIGLSAYLGLEYTSVAITGFQPIFLPGLSDLPVLGPTVFSLDALVYLSWVLLFGVSVFLFRTKAGLLVRGIGEAPAAAHTLGYRVLLIRFCAVLFGGGMAGLGGAYLALAYTPLWVEGMTAGRGWISLALVVFATWRPGRLLAGAYLFGGLTIAQFHLQSAGLAVPSQLLSALPYLATIVVLVLISGNTETVRLNAPAGLGKAYHPRLDD